MIPDTAAVDFTIMNAKIGTTSCIDARSSGTPAKRAALNRRRANSEVNYAEYGVSTSLPGKLVAIFDQPGSEQSPNSVPQRFSNPSRVS